MDAEQFTMWLHGYLEIANPTTIGEKETQEIKNHLDLLFIKKTDDLNGSGAPAAAPYYPYPSYYPPISDPLKTQTIC